MEKDTKEYSSATPKKTVSGSSRVQTSYLVFCCNYTEILVNKPNILNLVKVVFISIHIKLFLASVFAYPPNSLLHKEQLVLKLAECACLIVICLSCA